jgi:hypothetical protein
MNEDIGSVFLLDEAETLFVIKPFNCSAGHGTILLSMIFSKF